ncbi:hypothetical protein EI94DRAFT_1702881 [Lactarius quietus]|nr:hypothetical protein EI94DRAFT_1702881 [Lactarius quietus]
MTHFRRGPTRLLELIFDLGRATCGSCILTIVKFAVAALLACNTWKGHWPSASNAVGRFRTPKSTQAKVTEPKPSQAKPSNKSKSQSKPKSSRADPSASRQTEAPERSWS